MFSKFSKVIATESMLPVRKGMTGEVRAEATSPDSWIGVKWDGLRDGHSLGGELDGPDVESGYYVPARMLSDLHANPYKVGQWLKVTADHDSARKGMVGILRQIRKSSFQPLAIEFPGWTEGHDLHIDSGDVKLTGEASHSGHYLPYDKVVKVSRPKGQRSTRKPKVGSYVRVTRDYDEAKAGMTGTVITVPEPGAYLYGLKLNELTRGHNLSGALGYGAIDGQWVAPDHFVVTNKPRKAKASSEAPTSLKGITLPEDMGYAKLFDVRLTEAVTTQDGYKVNPGIWTAQAFHGASRDMVIVSFGKGKVLIFEADDKRLQAV